MRRSAIGPSLTSLRASILIPAFNAAPWIAQAIESALAQGPDVEVVVVDDGSTDGTLGIIEGFSDRIRFQTGPQRGAPAARNTALSLSRAPWVQFLDADDYLLPGKVRDQLEVVDQQPDVDVLYGPETLEVQGSGAPVQSWAPIDPPYDPYVLLALWKLPQTGAPLWRKAALEDVGGWREDQPCCQEHELYLRLLMAGKRFSYHPSARGAVYRRFDGGTLSTRNPAQVRAERARILHRLAEDLRLRGELTAERQWAIDQGFFDMARASWNEDREEARQHYAAISGNVFSPFGKTAPPAYRLVHRMFGFEGAERVAATKRRIASAFRPSG